jgi:hypothetical protein
MPNATRPTLGQWFRPLFFGTFGGAWAAAAVHALTDPRLAWLPYVGVVKWVLYLVAFSVLATVVFAATALFDTLLLRFKVRTLPTGGRAWALAAAAPFLGGVALKAWPMVTAEAWMLWVASLALPMLGVSGVSRVVMGRRP